MFLDFLNFFCFLGENWIPWIHFNRYIVGKPNLLYLPIKVRMGYSNKFLNAGGLMTQKIEGIHVLIFKKLLYFILKIQKINFHRFIHIMLTIQQY